jgi:hypothetical protein
MRLRTGICVLSLIVLTSVVGCPDPRTTNQGGGSLLTVASKLASNVQDPPIGQLNPDEWQVLADNIPNLIQMLSITTPDGTTIPTVVLTDQQAQDIVDFLSTYEINSVSDLATLIEQASTGEVQVDIPQSLIDLAQSLWPQPTAS